MKHSNGKKITITTTAFLFLSAALSAETKNNAITMPTMPTVPTVSVPSIGGGFYTPSSDSFYSGPSGVKSQSNPKVQNTTAPTAPTAPTKPTKPESNRVLTEEMKKQLNNELKNGGIKSMPAYRDSEKVTASDISNLDSLGLLGSISGILSNSEKPDYEQEKKNSQLLEEVLSELKEIKSGTNSDEQAVSFSTVKEKDSKILRFMANNADYMRTLKAVYFSKEEADGTFLLTGDLKYSIGGKPHNETFYLLFKSAGVEVGTTKYTVTASVSQDSAFDSFMKKLSDLSTVSEVVATRTGNLITMRINEAELKMDLLLAME